MTVAEMIHRLEELNRPDAELSIQVEDQWTTPASIVWDGESAVIWDGDPLYPVYPSEEL